MSAQDDQGARGEVRVRLGRFGADSDSEIVTEAKATNGRSAVEGALAADPRRLPIEIVVGPEGSQPIYE